MIVLNQNTAGSNDNSVWTGGAVTLWLVRAHPDRAGRVQALAMDIVLCSWAKQFALTVSLSRSDSTMD